MSQTETPALHPEFDAAQLEAQATAERLGGETVTQLEAASQTLKGVLEAAALGAAAATEKITTLRGERDALKLEVVELKKSIAALS